MHPLQLAVSKLSRNLLYAKHRVWVQKVIVGEAKKKKNSVAGAEATKVVVGDKSGNISRVYILYKKT